MSAPGVPPFLAALGIDEVDGLDERALRRGYARRLKQIDIEADPAAFQALRESLEQAQGWLAWRARQVAASTPQAEADAPEAAAAAPAMPVPAPSPEAVRDPAATPRTPAPPAPDTQGAQTPDQQEQARRWRAWRERQDGAASAPPPPPPSAPPAVPARPDRATIEAIANQVFAELAARIAQGLASETAAAAALHAAWTDERLANLDARSFFEWRVALLLAEGWRHGHEFLFDPAARGFEWQSDHARLGAFGPVGARLAAAMRERIAFEQMPAPQQRALRVTLAALRAGGPIDPAALRDEIPRIQVLVERFPNWLRIVAPQDAVNERIEMWNRIPPDRQPGPTPARAASTTTPRFYRPAKRWGENTTSMAWLVFGAIGLVIKMLVSFDGPNRPQAELRAPPTNERRVDDDLLARQQQAEALLQRVTATRASAPAAQAQFADAPAPRRRPASAPRYDASFDPPGTK